MKRAACFLLVVAATEFASAGYAWGEEGNSKDPEPVRTIQPGGKNQPGKVGVGRGGYRPPATSGTKPKTAYKIVTERNYRGPETAHCPDGVGWRRWRVRRSDNQRLNVTSTGCGWGPETFGDRKEVLIPVPVVGVSPRAEGLTGLATGLWYEGPAERSVGINVAGEAMTVTYAPKRFTWSMGDGSAPITSTQPGSAEAWATEHTYETRGDYVIELEVVWEGSYTRTPPGGAPESVAVTPITVTGTLDYHVIEIRSGLEN